MPQAIVVIDNVTKCFGKKHKPALNAISSQIFAGKMTGIVGPDGAGKTTLMRLLIGLLSPSSGKILINGFDTSLDLDQIHKIAGYMPQKFGLYEDLSVIENLKLYATVRNVVGKEREDKFEQLFNFTALKPFTSRLAGQLSGGMKQKLGLACALIGTPKILLLDEPSVGVDPISRQELWKMVTKLLQTGMAVVWATSYLDEASKCDNIILLNEGSKLHDGPPAELIKNVQGRTWSATNVKESERRKILMKIISKSSVTDGVIKGQGIYIVTKNKVSSPALGELTWHKRPAVFEDAFIDVLGGIPAGQSKLALAMIPKPLTEKPVIDAQNLTKKFGNFTAVNDVSFQIKQGEIFGLLGPNGAGKSTTFKMMCGLLQPTTGYAFVTGLDLKTASASARAHIGYMAQKFSLYGNLNVIQNLKFFSGLYGLSGYHQEQEIKLMIELFGFENYLKMKADTLPLGLKQRLALSCAVMHRPDVLFLDEPTSGVDPITRREFWTHINALIGKGVTVMVTTHFMDEAEYCDRIGLVYNGQNIATGTPDALKDRIKSKKLPNPTLEDAFIELIKEHDAKLKQGLAV